MMLPGACFQVDWLSILNRGVWMICIVLNSLKTETVKKDGGRNKIEKHPHRSNHLGLASYSNIST